jgi:putative copper export protein
MDSPLIIFGHWLQNRPYALAIAGSDWAYPIVQATHFTGLSIWIGTIIAMDLSLLGVGRKPSASLQLSEALFTWNWIGFVIAITGGFLLFSISAETYVANPAFQTKLGLLIPLGLVLHIVIQTKARRWEESPEPPLAAKIAGGAEMLLWLGVVTAAVLIPYVG